MRNVKRLGSRRLGHGLAEFARLRVAADAPFCAVDQQSAMLVRPDIGECFNDALGSLPDCRDR
ncbi:hypothetical protein WBP07_20625 (plasmid) [Novosphingobium sp. BL-8A]|uniref:hypothetical protein n=1 Tax=Novosphingobium sp. BL-8A TaxID=3127639 RepID=UPI0037569D24